MRAVQWRIWQMQIRSRRCVLHMKIWRFVCYVILLVKTHSDVYYISKCSEDRKAPSEQRIFSLFRTRTWHILLQSRYWKNCLYNRRRARSMKMQVEEIKKAKAQHPNAEVLSIGMSESSVGDFRCIRIHPGSLIMQQKRKRRIYYLYGKWSSLQTEKS